MPRFCRFCGKELKNPQARFCPVCGRQLASSGSPDAGVQGQPRLVIRAPGQPLREVVLDREAFTVGRKPDNDIVLPLNYVSGHHGRLERQMEHYLSNRRQKQEALSAQLKAFSPQRVLERGYAIVRCEAGDIVRNPAQLDSGDRMDVRVALGSFRAVKE